MNYNEVPGWKSKSVMSRLSTDALPDFPLLSHNDNGHFSYSEFLDRSKLAEILTQYNKIIGNPLNKAIQSAIKANGRFIITGQQPGLLTGPMYTFLKAVSVINMTHYLQPKFDVPLIPAFWIASEDHDILEINRCEIRNRQFVCEYNQDLITGQTPQAGEITLSDCREPLLSYIDEVLPKNDFKKWVFEVISTSDFTNYRSFFASLLAKLFSDWSLVLIDPIELRSLTNPVLARAVDRWPDIQQAFLEGRKTLETSGFKANLDSVDIFEIVDNSRVKCLHEAGRIKLSSGFTTHASAADMIRRRDNDFSPGAALRPIVQDAVLPTVATIGGAAELQYLWQITPLYDVLDVTRSKLYPRISATFLNPDIRRVAEKANIYPDRVFQAGQILDDYNPIQPATPEIDQIKKLGERYIEAIHVISKQRERKWVKKSGKSVLHHINKINTRLVEEELERQGRGRRNLERIRDTVLPGGKPQERVFNVFHFLCLFGPEFIRQCIEKLDPELISHQLVIPESSE